MKELDIDKQPESLFQHLPIDIQTIEPGRTRGQPIGIDEPLFFNGPFAAVPGERFAIFGRLARVTDWATRETASRMVGTVVDLAELLGKSHPIHHVFQHQLVEFSPLDHGYSVEDMRLTPTTVGESAKTVAAAVLYRGKRPDDSHDVSLGISLAAPDFSAVPPLQRIGGTDGYKNGVFMGTDSAGVRYLLARSMYETDTVTVFTSQPDQPWSQWRIHSLLPLKSHLPADIQSKILRLGPGTNPVELPERTSWIALFHWVLHVPDPQDATKEIEVYRGGLIEYASITPPVIKQVVPYALSPLDHPEEFHAKPGLFEDKQVVFPVGLVRTIWNNEPSYLVSYGFNDAYQHFAAASVADILAALA